MKEETTPIEELIEDIKRNPHSEFDTEDVLIIIDNVIEAYREKYKHTKEDVIEANYRGIKLGWKDAVNEFKDPTKVMIPKSTDALAEQYYNETHKNQD